MSNINKENTCEITYLVQKGIFNMQQDCIRRLALKSCLCAISAFLTLALFAGAARAQTETGQITGKVTDPTGAVVPGATVSVKSVETGRTITITSTDEGIYTAPALQPGLYDVTIQAGSFKPATKRVQVTVGSRVTVDTQLAISEVAGTV